MCVGMCTDTWYVQLRTTILHRTDLLEATMQDASLPWEKLQGAMLGQRYIR